MNARTALFRVVPLRIMEKRLSHDKRQIDTRVNRRVYVTRVGPVSSRIYVEM